MDIPEALKLIAGRSAVAQHEAIKALRASARAQQMRYNSVAEAALTDYAASFSPEERDAVLALIDWPEDGPRSERVYIRLSEAELAQAQARADSETGGNLSELVRRLLLAS